MEHTHDIWLEKKYPEMC